MSSIVAVIPARGGSKRLTLKNIHPICGKPMIAYGITACKNSKHIDRVFVSTEDEEIKAIALEYGAEVIDRPLELAGDEIWMQEVVQHAVSEIENKDIDIEMVVRVQANSPMVETQKIDEAILKLKAQEHKLFEVFSVDQDGFEDAAIHVLLRDTVFQKALSVYKAVIMTNYIDIHTIEDVQEVERKWGNILRDRL